MALSCTLRMENCKSLSWLIANQQVEIVELKDLEKAYSLARIRLTLAQHDPSAIAVAGRIQQSVNRDSTF